MTSICAMALLAQNPVFGVAVTLFAYEIGCWVQRRCGGRPLVNPVLIAIVLIVTGLELCGIPYDTYLKGAGLIPVSAGPGDRCAGPAHLRQRRAHPRRCRRSRSGGRCRCIGRLRKCGWHCLGAGRTR